MAVMTLSGFRAVGHMECCKRIYGYLSKMRNAVIRICTDEPDYLDIPIPSYDWEKSVYGAMSEIIPDNILTPCGKQVVFTTYVDANLYHDMLTG